MAGKPRRITPDKLRSRLWFDNPDNPGMTALYIERYLNFGLTAQGAAVREADHRHRPDRLRPLALQPPPPRTREARARGHHGGRRRRVRVPDAIRSRRPASGRPPASTATSPICRSSRCSTATPLDGVVLLTGCDKTMPACLMAAATVNIPAISLNVGPMLNGWQPGRAHRLRHRRLEGARAPRRRRHRLPAVHRHRRLARRRRSATATPWAPPRP